MTEKDYRSHPAISRSELWKMNDSAEKFRWAKDHPSKPTPAQLFGQVTHKLLLEPDTFGEDFCLAPAVDRRTKQGKEDWEAFVASCEGRTVVDDKTYAQAAEMVKAAREIPLVVDLLSGEHETPFFWTDPDTGEECKCRLDAWKRDGRGVPIIVDYKTANDCSYRAFLRDVVNYGYYFQAAMYSEGLIHNGLCPRLIKGQPRRKWEKDPATGKRHYWTEYPEQIVMGGTEGEIIQPRFVFIVQEKTAPYSINVFEMDMDFLAEGYNKYRELIGAYHTCKTLDIWPGPMGAFNEPQILTLPGWMGGGDE